MIMWRPYYKNGGRKVDRLLTDQEKSEWQAHPLTRTLFRYEKEETTPPPKIKIPQPIEAKKFTKTEPPQIAIKENPTEPKEIKAKNRKRGRAKN